MKSAHAPSRPGGYSVIELMTIVSVAATLFAVAVPALDSLALNERRTVLVNELLATLQHARNDAALRGQAVIVCGIVDSNRNGALDPPERRCAGRSWTDGWIVGFWQDANGDNRVDTNELSLLREHLTGASGRFTVNTGNFTATPPVAPAGTAVLKTFSLRSSNGTITICDHRGARQARAIILPPNGHPRISAKRADGTPLICP